MAITLNGTTGITTPAVTNEGAYTGDGVVFADGTPSNTLVTTTGGNVGIGTASPEFQLHLSGTAPRLQMTDTDTGGNSYVSASSSNGSLILAADENSTVANSVMTFRVDGSDKARFTSDGSFQVGTTSGTTASNENGISIGGSTGDIVARKENGIILFLRRWSTNGTVVEFRSATNASVGTIVTAASSTAYNTSSDYRLKENISPMTGALDLVQQLKPVNYTWKADGSAGQGFIAHELQAVVPDCVTGEKDAVDADGNPVYQGIDTSFLVATLTAAIQEQQAIISDLKARIETLEQSNGS